MSQPMFVPQRLLSLALAFVLLTNAAACFADDKANLRFLITNDHGDPIPCRIHLRHRSGAVVNPTGYPFWTDHFVCPGQATIPVAPDEYEWHIERGPEYRRSSGKVIVKAGGTTDVNATLTAIASLRDEGWYGGDLHVHRPVTEIELLMSAEDLDFAPVIGWWNSPAPNAVAAEKTEFRFGDDRYYCTSAGEDERAGGALLYFGLKQPLDLTVQSREFPSPMHFVQQAREQNPNVWIDVEKPFWWDVPTWLAVTKPDSIGIAHNHMHRGGVLDNEAWGNPRDLEQFPSVRGNGLWTQEIYYHILNCGMRIPPSAGSASGVLPNPIGYNRVYVQLAGESLTRDNWFAALKSGRCFVTNGPLLRVTANQAFAGETLHLDSNSKIQLEIKLASNDPVSELEVIYNGKVARRIPCTGATNETLNATVEVSDPGWLLVRATADVDHTFRFASTAPWYLQDEHQEIRVSRKSVGFLIDWIDKRIANIQANVDDVGQRESILKWHLQARDFYSELRKRASAD